MIHPVAHHKRRRGEIHTVKLGSPGHFFGIFFDIPFVRFNVCTQMLQA